MKTRTFTGALMKKATMTLLLAGAAACGTQTDPAESDPESYPKVASKWASPAINVCWESSSGTYATEKAWVKAKVESQYEGKTRVRFNGWGTCQSGASGIRIAVSDSPGANPHTKGLGRYLNGVRNGMELNFTFNNWSTSCRSRRQKCVESIGVHEFGHAIGLAHEHNRPDTPSTCKQSRQGTQGDVRVGSWDSNSVMNYCNPVYNNGGNLSSGDVAGISRMYGAL